MPFQPINFLNAETPGNPAMRDLVENLTKGYQASQMPAQMNRDRQKEELANSMSQLLLQQQPEKFKAEMTRNKLLDSLTGMQIQNAQIENDPSRKVQKVQAFIQALKNSGMNVTPELINGMMRKSAGLEEQSPAEKLNQEISKYRATHAATTSDDITTANKTKNLSISQAVDDTLPMLKQLRGFEEPGQLVGKYWSPDQQATYEGMTGAMIDSLLGAFNLPKTNESIAQVHNMVVRRPRESNENYHKRLTELGNELSRRKQRAMGSMGQGNKAGNTFNLGTGAWE